LRGRLPRGFDEAARAEPLGPSMMCSNRTCKLAVQMTVIICRHSASWLGICCWDEQETREIRHITSGLAGGSGTCSDGYLTASDIQLRCRSKADDFGAMFLTASPDACIFLKGNIPGVSMAWISLSPGILQEPCSNLQADSPAAPGDNSRACERATP
jgi:hypothetical protein